MVLLRLLIFELASVRTPHMRRRDNAADRFGVCAERRIRIVKS